MGNARTGKDTLAEHLAKTRGFVRIGLADHLKRYCQDVFQFTDAQVWGDEKEKPDPRYIHMKRGALGALKMSSWRAPDGSFDFTDTGWAGKEQLFEKSSDEYGNVPNPVEDTYLTPRYAMQRLGTEWGRDCSDSIWFDIGMRTARKLLEGGYTYTAKEGLRPAWDAFGQNPARPPAGVVFADFRFRNEFYPAKEQGAFMVRIIRPGFDGQVGIAGHQSEAEIETIPLSEFDLVLKNDGTLEDYYKKIDSFFTELLGKV
jgi:hypothetical protein